MGRSPRNKTVADRTVTVRLTRAEVQTLKKWQMRHQSVGQVLRELALRYASFSDAELRLLPRYQLLSPSPQPTQT